MKKTVLVLLALVLVITGCQNIDTADNNKLVIYTYDSLSAEWGLLPQILDEFKTQTSTEVEVVSFADTGTMMNQLILEKGAPRADIVLGLDNVNFPDAQKNDLLTAYTPTRASEIDQSLLFNEDYLMTPFDYGYVGWVYDSEKIKFPDEISLLDLASRKYKDQIIIEQVGASSPGTQLLLWTKAALSADDYNTFWDNVASNVLTTAPDWSTAYYSLFMEGEAPIVLSYLTSPAYHIDQEQTDRYKAIAIKEGYMRQVEGVGVVNNANNEKLAQKFIDYLLTDQVQNKIPTTQWMFPVLGDASTWPEAYQQIITPSAEQVLQIDPAELSSDYNNWLTEWNEYFGI
ncbi:MAG: thiamine ABC transporter substrate-binding protein [Patescibacteria group bacterium]